MVTKGCVFRTLELAVGCLGAVFAEVVVFGNVHRECGIGRSQRVISKADQNCAEGEAGDVFQHVGVLDGLGDGFSPGKGRMAGNQNPRYGDRVEVLQPEPAHDHHAGVADIGFGDFFGSEGIGDRHGP